MKPTFFETPATWRAWLRRNHGKTSELLVGLYKTGSGRRSITWPESVDQALCFGWIDGVRRRIDDDSYSIRFTPRKSTSTWSAINIDRVAALTADGKMAKAGLDAFARRVEARSRTYAYEQRDQGLDPASEQVLRANRAAWAYYQKQPPWYQRTSAWWVISAKKEATRQRRLATLIERCAQGLWIGPLERPTGQRV